MSDQIKNLLIGIFVIAACVLVVAFIMFLKPTVGDGKEILYVRFSNINKIGIGTRVTFAGRPVGEVVAIREIANARAEPTDTQGRFFYYELELKVDSSVKVYNTDQVSLQTSGLLGEKSVAISPRIPPRGVIPHLITNQPIYAESVDPIEQAFMQLSDLAEDMSKTINNLNDFFEENKHELSCAIQNFSGAMAQIESAIQELHDQNIIGETKIAIQSFSSTIHSMNDALEQMHQSGVFTNAGVVMNNLKCATQSINSITRTIADGKGSIGRLIKDDEFYLNVMAVMSKANTMMNDINHYGILFHLNKAWQRTRTKRLDMLNALQSPSDFKSYFETEVDQINTSMSRLSILVDKAEESPARQQIFDSDQFQRDFAELLRLSDQLSENLRLYNQQLMDAHEGIQRDE